MGSKLFVAIFAFTFLAIAPAAVAFQHAPPVQTFTARYTSGTIQVNSDETGNQAWGVLTCGPTTNGAGFAGGACFDVSRFPGAELHVTITDDVRGADVSAFAGFDRDFDGCVGCTSADAAWEGVGELSAFAGSDRLFQVFVRTLGDEPTHPAFLGAAEVPDAHAGVSGTITVDVYGPVDGPCFDHQEGGDVRHCGQVFRGAGPYPYENL